jgi:hypothetical protein
MQLEDIKTVLQTAKELSFLLPDGTAVPAHFHVTEVGKVDKHFIDCGGKMREESVANFQLWSANDYDHRLHPEKLLHIIELSQEKLGLSNETVEVEYQNETIGKYSLDFDGTHFILQPKQTACLALESCGVPSAKPKRSLATLTNASKCSPNSGCC